MDLRRADLQGVDLRGAILHGCCLRGAVLDGACLAQVRARDVDLEGASLVKVDLSGAQLSRAILLEANLLGASLCDADLRGCDLRAATLDGADLTRSDMSGATLAGASLPGTRIEGAKWSRAHLRNVLGLDETQRAALLAMGAWEGVAVPELEPLAALGLWLLRPPARWVRGRTRTLESRVRGWLGDQAEARRRRMERRARKRKPARPAREPRLGKWLSDRQKALGQYRLQRIAKRVELREHQRAERLAALPGGPGQDLSGQDLAGRPLQDVDWTGAKLRGIHLAGAHLQGALLSDADLCDADLTGARLADATLVGAKLRGAKLTDADLRRVQLMGADLEGADLTGVDLRGSQLQGANLRGADLTAARLANLDLSGLCLDAAVFDQADLTGTDLSGSTVNGADLRGALGLSSAQRAEFTAAGATSADIVIGDLLKHLHPRQAVIAAGVLVLGLGSYGAARLLGPRFNPPTQAESAAQIRSLPPAQAQARFEALAADADEPGDKVAWLMEAAGQARVQNEPDAEVRLLRAALAAAGEDVRTGAEVRLRLATRMADNNESEAAMALVNPLLDLSRQPPEQRARAVLLYQKLGHRLDVDTKPRLDAVFLGLERLPDAATELYLALADAASEAGDFDTAMGQVNRAAKLKISDASRARVLETRARTYDRAGDLTAAASAWQTMADKVEAGSSTQDAALLALSDVRVRQGDPAAARVLLEPLLKAGTDPRIRTRAWLVQARLDEAIDDAVAAAESYRQAILLAKDEPELAEDARQALVRLVGSAGDERRELLLADLDPEARALVSIQIKLGEARALLESGQAEQAQAAFTALLEQDDLDPISKRDIRTGLGEALARQGQTAQALVVWRDLLSETAQAQDRIFLRLRIADGLLDGGRYDDAAAAFDEIAENSDPDISAQGKLGLAQVSLARGERERARADLQLVADQARDPAWRVRALEELATIATQDGDPETALSAWRSVLAAASPGDAAIGRARLAVVQILAELGRVDAARAACRDAVKWAVDRRDRLRSMLSCAELDQRQGGEPIQALDHYEDVLAQATDPAHSSPPDIIVDAATAAAGLALSLDQPDRAFAAASSGLGQARQAAERLALLDLQVQALDALGQDSSAAMQARDSLVKAAPEAALGMLVERAHQAQGQDARDAAITLLSQGVAAVSDPSLALGARLELADVQLDAGQIDAADANYATVGSSSLATDDERFQAEMGRAQVLEQRGDPAAAAAVLADIKPPNTRSRRWLVEAQARALAEAGDAASLEAWDALVTLGQGDPTTEATALRGKADALFADDRYADALPLYQQAADLAPDPGDAGWAALGAANALAAMGDPAAPAKLAALMDHPDPEVAVQAAVRRSQIAAEAEDWDTARQVLRDVDASSMGSAWDTTVSLTRAAALSGAGSYGAASEVIAALCARWPNDEEAQLPALLAQADMARAQGDMAAARAYTRQAQERAQDPGFQQQAQALMDQLAKQ